MTAPHWRERLYTGELTADENVKAALLDTDLRIANLPDAGEISPVKHRLQQWLDRIADGLATPGAAEVSHTSLRDLRIHVLQVERAFRTAPVKYSIMYMASLLLWGGALYLAWHLASGRVSLDQAQLGVTGRAWLATFVVGVAGSVTMVLSRIYQGNFEFTDIRFTPRTWRMNAELSRLEAFDDGKPDSTGRRITAWFDGFLTNDMARVSFRAFVRPILGGVVAVAVFLILISGLILEPLVAPMLPETGAVDFVDARSAAFFLSIAFVAGFSDQLAWGMLNTLMNKLGGDSSHSHSEASADGILDRLDPLPGSITITPAP